MADAPAPTEYHLLSDDPEDPLYRLRLSVDEDGLFTLAEENISSRGPRAQVTGYRTVMDLVTEEARWLVGRVGVLWAASQRDKAQPVRSPGFERLMAELVVRHHDEDRPINLQRLPASSCA